MLNSGRATGGAGGAFAPLDFRNCHIKCNKTLKFVFLGVFCTPKNGSALLDFSSLRGR